MKPTVIIKEQNRIKIANFAKYSSYFEGLSLKALYTLIQKKGEPIKSDDKNVNGVYALQFSDKELIAIKRTGLKGTFYPCMMKTYLLEII